MSLVDVAAAEIGDTTNATAKYIADNLAAVVEALGTSRGALTIQDVHNWHRRLMADSNLSPEMIGAFRTTQSWIGGTSLRDAAFVPPDVYKRQRSTSMTTCMAPYRQEQADSC